MTDIFLRLKNSPAYDYYVYGHYGTDEGLTMSGGPGKMPGIAITYGLSEGKINKPKFVGDFTQ